MMPVEYIVGIPEITEVCGIKENSSACVLLPVYIHIQVVTVFRMLYDRIIDDSRHKSQDSGFFSDRGSQHSGEKFPMEQQAPPQKLPPENLIPRYKPHTPDCIPCMPVLPDDSRGKPHKPDSCYTQPDKVEACILPLVFLYLETSYQTFLPGAALGEIVASGSNVEKLT